MEKNETKWSKTLIVVLGIALSITITLLCLIVINHYATSYYQKQNEPQPFKLKPNDKDGVPTKRVQFMDHVDIKEEPERPILNRKGSRGPVYPSPSQSTRASPPKAKYRSIVPNPDIQKSNQENRIFRKEYTDGKGREYADEHRGNKAEVLSVTIQPGEIVVRGKIIALIQIRGQSEAVEIRATRTGTVESLAISKGMILDNIPGPIVTYKPRRYNTIGNPIPKNDNTVRAFECTPPHTPKSILK